MITYTTASEPEIDILLNWAAREGWNPGLDDARAFFAVDPDGFFLAKDDGVPIAGISVVRHSDAFAFLGLYLCLPDRRGEGIGYGLWQHALEHAGTRVVGLDGVPDQQANYRQSGFVWAGETTRYTGSLPTFRAGEARAAWPEDIAPITKLEAAASGVSKPAYIAAWCRPAATRQTFVLDGPSGLLGAVTIRQCRTGFKIGPLIAPNVDTALALIAAATEVADGADVSIDVPGSAAGLTRICIDAGMTPGFSTARMYRGAAPKGEAPFFAVVSLELG